MDMVGMVFLLTQVMTVGVSNLTVVASIGWDESSNPVRVGLSITLAIDVVDTAIGISISAGVDTGIAVDAPGI